MIPKIQTIQVNNNDVSPKRVNVGTRGSYGVTKLNFELSPEWDGSACEVVFHPKRGKPISVVWAGVPIDVPAEIMEHNGIAGYVFSGIQRSSYDTEESVKRVSLPGELEVLFTLGDKGGNSKGFTPSMYSQILALIGDLGSLTTDARENLVAAINEAAQSGSGDIDEDTIRDIIMDYLEENPIDAPVMSVNGQTGNVQLDATDVDAVPASELVNAINTALAVAKQSGEFDGNDGNDGVSPTVKVTNITGGHRIAITDVNGTKTVDVMDGKDGQDGKDGRGITEIKRTSGNGAAGTTDTYTIYYTDGTTSVFTVYNGANGSGGGGSGSGEDGATFIPDVDVNGNLSWTNNKGLPNPETVNIKGPNGDDGRGIKTIARTNGNGAAGTTDTYTITYTDDTTSTFNVYNGKNGTNVTITDVTNNTGSGETNTVTFSDGKTLNIKNGSDGKTPVKGTDYWTETDKASMVSDVLAALPTWNGGSY